MKTKSIQLILVLVLILSGTAANSLAQTNPQTQTMQLFNGTDLSNWTFFLRDPAVNPATVFTVQNGVIHVTGSFGYMRTKEVYSNYKLHVEYRYPTTLTNSGIFVHTQGPDAIWPLTIENQLKAGNAGDYVCMSGADMINRVNRLNSVVAKSVPSTEKPVGEWNTVDIICNGNTIETYVNGTLMNKGRGLSITKGSICLQSEGEAIEFRNVVLSPLF